MKDFIKTTQTMKDFMESRGFTLFKDKRDRLAVWVAKFAEAETDITGRDKFIVFDDDIECGEIWEFRPEDRKHLTDDEIAQMIADVADADLPTWCVTSISTESYLFSK